MTNPNIEPAERLYKVKIKFFVEGEIYLGAPDEAAAQAFVAQKSLDDWREYGSLVPEGVEITGHEVGAVAQVTDPKEVDPGWLTDAFYNLDSVLFSDTSFGEAFFGERLRAAMLELPEAGWESVDPDDPVEAPNWEAWRKAKAEADAEFLATATRERKP